MDWEPSPHAAVTNGGWTRRRPMEWDGDHSEDIMDHHLVKSDWDAFGAGKQRMFGRPGPDTQETGLESLLAGWGIGGTPSEGSDLTVNRQTNLTHIGTQTGFVLDQGLLKTAMALLSALRVLGILTWTLCKGVSQDIEQTTSASLQNCNGTLLGLEILVYAINILLVARRPEPFATPGRVGHISLIALSIAVKVLSLVGLPILEKMVPNGAEGITSWVVHAMLDGLGILS
jgi:hypothetical protein